MEVQAHTHTKKAIELIASLQKEYQLSARTLHRSPRGRLEE